MSQLLIGRGVNDADYDIFSGDASTTSFTLSNATSTKGATVTISGVTQRPGTDFTVSGTTLTFTSAPPTGTNNILVQYNKSITIGAPGDGTVTLAKMAANSVDSDQYVDGSIDLAHLANESKPYDIGFQAGIAGDGTAADLVVQRYGKMILPRAVTFEDVEIHMDTAGTGQSVIFDIELNGTSIFSTRPECDASSQTEDGNHAFTTTTGAAGDYLEFHVDQIGSGTAGAGAAFTLKARTGS